MILRRGIYSQRFEGENYQRINFNSQGISNDELSIGTIVNGFRTISFFFTPTIDINSGTPSMVIGTQDGVTYNVGQMFFWFQSGKLYFLTRYSSGAVQIASDTSSFSANTEYHVSIVINPTSGFRMVLNAVSQSTTNSQTGVKPTNSQPFIFGRNRATWTKSEIKIRNVQIWSNALTNLEIDTYKNQYLPAGTTNLIETYHFKDEQGTTVTGENGNNGTISTSNAGGVTYIDTVMRETI